MSRLAQARARNRHEAGEAIDREVMETMLATLGQKLNLLLRLKLEVERGQRVAEKIWLKSVGKAAWLQMNSAKW